MDKGFERCHFCDEIFPDADMHCWDDEQDAWICHECALDYEKDMAAEDHINKEQCTAERIWDERNTW